MAILHAAAGTALAKAAVYDPTGLATVKIIVIAVLAGAAALWSALDGWRTGGQSPRPRSRRALHPDDLGRTWLIAAVIAGPLSGILFVIGRAVLVDQSGAGELRDALIGGAAFTALLVLVPALLGMVAGKRITPRKTASARE
ncbi:B-4DMT family transporter [Amycolatopsis pigmentata]|uniref:B-4DMT family transporter n=1 Tax=Amycolatopsis pigmentata TaxID=450801 RepID=A0ABW5FMV7_9PSEU